MLVCILISTYFACDANVNREQWLYSKGVYYSDTLIQKIIQKWTKDYIPAAIYQKKERKALQKALHYFKILEHEFPENRYNYEVQRRIVFINSKLGNEYENKEIFTRLLGNNQSKTDSTVRFDLAMQLAEWLRNESKNRLNDNKIRVIWRFLKVKHCGCVVFLPEYKVEESAFILTKHGYLDLSIEILNFEINRIDSLNQLNKKALD